MLNPDLIEKLGNNAREHVFKEFNPQKVTAQIIDAYKLAMRNRDRRLG
jgi:glycosyltransferase involved in cell wall biosynthesis